MRAAPLPGNETGRLEALRQTGVLDTPPEESFDRLTDLAARICGTPIALITLVDVDRQWFKSHVGVQIAETPREVSLCAHAILEPGMLIVRDTLDDPRFADNPLVQAEPKVRFYAGCPLVTHDGNAIGTFCIVDREPRDLDAFQIGALEKLAHHATTLLELRRVRALLASAAAEWERAGSRGDRGAATSALERLGAHFEELVRAREEVEQSFRRLERLAPPANPAEDEELGHSIVEILRGSQRLLEGLGPDHPLRADVARIGECARAARRALERARPPRTER